MTGSPDALEMRDVSAGYGASDIIASVTLRAARGRITTIAGPNGAGKSTLMKTLVGLLRPRRGQIVIDGRDITRLSPSQRASAGLGYVPQERNVFKNLTIGENLRIGFEFIRRKAAEKEFRASRDRVLDIFPDLSQRLGEVAGTLSGGQRQMLAMGCALIPGPSALLLDEPSAGLSPRYVTTMLEAMSMGKAVIVTETRGQRDVIQHGTNGIYVPPGDPQALRAAISHLLAFPSEAARLGANARRTVESEMSLDLWAERISRVVRQVAMRSAI